MEKRLVLFLLLSAVIFFGWSYVYTKLYPPPPKLEQNQDIAPSASPTVTTTPAVQAPVEVARTNVPATQAEVRQIKVRTDYWVATLSNQGGVITEWTMTHFPDGKPIDPPNGV